jgi:hypothetical protein
MPRLHPANWKSGEIIRLIDLVAPFGNPDAMIAGLRQVVPAIEIGGVMMLVKLAIALAFGILVTTETQAGRFVDLPFRTQDLVSFCKTSDGKLYIKYRDDDFVSVKETITENRLVNRIGITRNLCNEEQNMYKGSFFEIHGEYLQLFTDREECGYSFSSKFKMTLNVVEKNYVILERDNKKKYREEALCGPEGGGEPDWTMVQYRDAVIWEVDTDGALYGMFRVQGSGKLTLFQMIPTVEIFLELRQKGVYFFRYDDVLNLRREVERELKQKTKNYREIDIISISLDRLERDRDILSLPN